MLLTLHILFGYWAEDVTFGLLYVMSIFFSRVFYMMTVPVVFSAVDWPLKSIMLIHFLEI